jgi:acyl carrier protein
MNEIESALKEFVMEHFAVDSLRMGMDLREDLDLSDGDIYEIISFAEDNWELDFPSDFECDTLGEIAEYIEENI